MGRGHVKDCTTLNRENSTDVEMYGVSVKENGMQFYVAQLRGCFEAIVLFYRATYMWVSWRS
jgi:hypothetical protein